MKKIRTNIIKCTISIFDNTKNIYAYVGEIKKAQGVISASHQNRQICTVKRKKEAQYIAFINQRTMEPDDLKSIIVIFRFLI